MSDLPLKIEMWFVRDSLLMWSFIFRCNIWLYTWRLFFSFCTSFHSFILIFRNTWFVVCIPKCLSGSSLEAPSLACLSAASLLLHYPVCQYFMYFIASWSEFWMSLEEHLNIRPRSWDQCYSFENLIPGPVVPIVNL